MRRAGVRQDRESEHAGVCRRMSSQEKAVIGAVGTLRGCSIKRRQGHLGESSDSLWLQGPRGGV